MSDQKSQPQATPLRSYGESYLKALENLRPEEYARRSGSSNLLEEAIAAQRRAEAQEDTLLVEMLRQDPGPQSYMARVQHYRVLEQMAREIALSDMMPEPETSSPSDPETSPTSRAATTD